MANELRTLRLSKNIPAQAIVNVIKKFHPNFDKPMLSKCERGDTYGITLKPAVMDALIDKFAPETREVYKRRRNGHHRLTCRITCRLENDDYTALQRLIKGDGFGTMQDWLSFIVKRYINQK